MPRDYDRLASLFTDDALCETPEAHVKLSGRAEIRAGNGRMQAEWEFFVQNTHPGAIRLEGDTAYGRAHIHQLGCMRDGMPGVNFALYHDRYRRTALEARGAPLRDPLSRHRRCHDTTDPNGRDHDHDRDHPRRHP
ncbi:YybH family protein [Streptomyces murinus]|uniref:YybH family protein n=1 Tax=Streptomyces murinus TaxID=33900 RepID=UPI003F457B01